MASERIELTWTLMRYASDVLRRDKELLVFTTLSTALCVALFAAIFYGDLSPGAWGPGDLQPEGWSFKARAFLFLFLAYFFITFFNSAIAACAILRLRGVQPTLGDGFRIAFSRLPWIAGWALLSATVVMVLRIVEEKVKWGRWLRLGLEVPWALASFLVVPIIVVERLDPFRALDTSARLIRNTWGEQVVAGVSFGVVQLTFMVPAVVLALLVGLMDLGASGHLLFYALLAAYVVLVFLVVTTLEAIFRAALYCHVRHIETPGEILPNVAAAAIRRGPLAPRA